MRHLVPWVVASAAACVPFSDGGSCPQSERVPVFADNDGDGFGRVPLGDACEVGEGRSADGTDCNDSRPKAFPGAPEICDGFDNDCDGEIDEGVATSLYFEDVDGDGYGDNARSIATCQPPSESWSLDGGDCDDAAADVHPGVLEDCANALDDDCDQLVDCNDPSCASDPGCLLPCADGRIEALLPAIERGSTEGRANDWEASCVSSGSPDVALQFVAPFDGSFVFDTFGSAIDTVLYAYDGCGGVEIACDDDVSQGVYASQIELALEAGEVVLIVVDGFSDSTEGDWTLNVSEL